jgi:hypothetical protein
MSYWRFPKKMGWSSIGEARSSKKFGSISRQRVKRFLREAYAVFEGAGVFGFDDSSGINSSEEPELGKRVRK